VKQSHKRFETKLTQHCCEIASAKGLAMTALICSILVGSTIVNVPCMGNHAAEMDSRIAEGIGSMDWMVIVKDSAGKL
jgi:hypothetical protein